jgi:hypothetical protein
MSFLHLTCANNHDKIVLIIFVVVHFSTHFFGFINLEFYKFVWLLAIYKYYLGVVCIKGMREQMSKHVRSFVIIKWKCISITKQKWRLMIKLKWLELCFNHVDCNLLEHFLSWVSSSCLGTHTHTHTHIYIYIIVLLLLLSSSLWFAFKKC